MTYEQLPLWFRNRIKKVMATYKYASDEITATACDKALQWSPLDLILREHYNNGDACAKAFCGLTPSENRRAAEYAIENQEALKELDLYSEKAWNNCGITLWSKHRLY